MSNGPSPILLNQLQRLNPRQAEAAVGLQGLLNSPDLIDDVRAVAPSAVDPKRLVSVMLTAATKTPKLLECSPPSMMRALMHCAELGLEPGGALGHIYLIPRKGEVSVQIGYKGLAELARRTGQISEINAGVVYEDELMAGGDRPAAFVATLEPPTIEHRLAFGVDRSPGKLRLAYAVVRTSDGGRYQAIVMPEDIDKAMAAAH
ncbi:MAG: hypothetical protein GY873_33045, partial [Bosea sp.]|uniref:recombinase RecT n=1 Tax=Bosea sp. (in: a-proteobacteria) TaxID=1871050 RepID=UPI0023A3BE0C|nr:hypothetical protein [Bosea sp. (in: a-proteobacteria)]